MKIFTIYLQNHNRKWIFAESKQRFKISTESFHNHNLEKIFLKAVSCSSQYNHNVTCISFTIQLLSCVWQVAFIIKCINLYHFWSNRFFWMPGLTLEDIDHKDVTGLFKKSPKINSKKCKFPKNMQMVHNCFLHKLSTSGSPLLFLLAPLP